MDSNEDIETCWICLEGVDGVDISPGPVHGNRLIKPCRCPRVVHSVCMAKWQLSQSGRSEEKFCRFCKERLPEWQANLALPGMGAVEPVMSVHFNGQTHMVKVKPGDDGRVAFIQDVRRLLRLRDNQEFSITFECKVPGHGMFLDLKGLSSYDAAVFCAAMTAVERQRLATQKAQKAAAFPVTHHAGVGALAPTSGAAAAGLASMESSSNSASSSDASSGNGSHADGAGSSGTSASTSTPTSAASTSPLTSPTYALSPILNPSRLQIMRGSNAGASDPDTGGGRARPRPVSVGDVDRLAPAAVRQQAAGSPSAIVADDTANPSYAAAAVPLGPAPTEWRLGGLILNSLDGAALNDGAAGDRAVHANGRSISGPPQHQRAGSARTPGGPPGWGSIAYDSACEVEPATPDGEGGAASAAPADNISSSAAAGGDVDAIRHKFSVWHGFRGNAARGTGGSSSSSSSSLPALSEHQPARRGDECGNVSWLCRLLLCASFGDGLDPSASS